MKAQEGVDLKTTARRGIATLGMLGLLACGSQSSNNYPPGAVLFANPSSLSYTGDGGSGTTVEPQLAAYVTTSQMLSIDLQDHGKAPLIITSVTLSDPSGGFMLIPPTPAGGEDAGKSPDGGGLVLINPHPESPADAYIGFYFAPTTVGPYTATITITSNSTANGGVTVIPITALGVTTDAGQ
jgi:hypothetical protein